MNSSENAILVIDSEQSWLEFCEKTLEDNDYEVHSASGIHEALAWFPAHPAQSVGLILLDYIVFQANESALTALRQEYTDTPRSVVMLFSTDLTPGKTRNAFKLGASDCVSKPYDETSLLALVEQMLADCRIAKHERRKQSRHSSRLLLVDDDPDWLVSLEKYLPEVEHVTKASTYREAVTSIREHSFDVVIVDLRLVDADDSNFQGMNLIEFLRAQDAERDEFTQVLIVSAYGTPEHIREAYRTHAIYYYFDKRYLSPAKYRKAIQEALV